LDVLDLVPAQLSWKLTGGSLIIGLIDDVDVYTQPAQAPHRGALGQGEGADVVSGSVKTEQQAGVALLGSTRAAGCQELEQAWAEVPACAMRAPMTEVWCTGDRSLVVGRALWRGRSSGGGHEVTS